jgi:hypothetical protein
MIKKQIDFQMEKFQFSSSLEGRAVYDQIRTEIKDLMKHGWEIFSVDVLGYEPTKGDAIVLVSLVRYVFEE